MKVDLCYPKIPHWPLKERGPCWASVKYDGTNLHWVWDGHRWTHFGTRRQRYPLTPEGIADFHAYHGLQLRHAPAIFQERYAPHLNMHSASWPVAVILFTEYLCPESFDGEHPEDAAAEDFRLVLIDSALGTPEDVTHLTPEAAQDLAHAVEWPPEDIAKVVWKGNTNGATFGRFLEKVRSGGFPDVVEGVVVKGLRQPLWRFKVKTDAWEARER